MVSDPLLDIHDIHKSYGATPALRGVSLSATEGEIVCLLGPSGCGKTTLLRIIAGLETPDSGSVRFDGQAVNALPAHRRGFGLMFQDYALFPHHDVAGNIAFGLRMRGLPQPAITARVSEMLTLVGLEGYERRRVYELSGGERQRVALARSLAPSPRLLLLDEPLGALDRTLRDRLLDDLRAILKRVGVTSIYVTHDQSEAFAIADRLALMNQGVIEQQGPPAAVYRHPATLFAARFFGLRNLVAGRVRSVTPGGGTLLATPLGDLRAASNGVAPGDAATAVIRPEAAALGGADGEGPNLLRGTVTERSFRGSRTRLTVREPGGMELEFDLEEAALPAVGEPIALRLNPAAISLIAGG